MLHDHRLFFRQFRENFHHTGSIAPSSRYLAQALARYVPKASSQPNSDAAADEQAAGIASPATSQNGGSPARGEARRILEVGPGTGAVTRWIIPRLAPEDHFDLVEMNDEFVAHLQRRFAGDPAFQPAADRARILHQPVEQLVAPAGYDAVISGLPLNNFSADLVDHLLTTLVGLLAPGGTLSFFEYVGVRRAKLLVAHGPERDRLQSISGHLDRLLSEHEFQCECVMRNLPPAWVHHVRIASKK